MHLNLDTERMVSGDIIHAEGTPGWALIPDPTDKEHRFCRHLDIEIIEDDIGELLACTRNTDALLEHVNRIGC